MKIIALSLLTALILAGCVSSGTYDAMVALRDSIKLKNDSLEKYISKANLVNNDLKSQLEEAKRKHSELQAELKGLKDTYEQMKSSSSDKTKELLSTIERLQKESNIQEQKIKEINDKLKMRENAINELKTKLTTALKGFTDKGLSVSIKDGKVYVSLSNQLLFQSGSTDIDQKGQDALLELAKELNNQPDINILVEGHTDNQKIRSGAKFKDNWDLSVLRATEVVRFLTVNGSVDPKRIIASGRSEYFPIEAGETPEARAVNRRTEIILTPKLDELFKMIDSK